MKISNKTPVGGACIGAISFSLLTVVWHYTFIPPVLRDEHYYLILLYTIPIGAMLGAAGAAVDSLRAAGKRRAAGFAAMLSGLLTLTFFTWFWTVTWGHPTLPAYLRLWGHGFLCAAVLMGWGRLLLKKRQHP